MPKTQIEDSPATDNKLESIVDVPGGAEEEEEEDQETDEDESDDLIHDDAEAPDHEKEEVEEEDKLKTSKSGDSAEVDGEVKINQSATGTTIYLASGESAASPGNPFQGQAAVHAIVLTGDEIMERLMAAEVIIRGPSGAMHHDLICYSFNCRLWMSCTEWLKRLLEKPKRSE